MRMFSWHTDDKPYISTYLDGAPKKRYLVVDGIDVIGRAIMHYKPNLKGGHTHNHVKNAHKRMKHCVVCDKPITKYEGFSSRFTGHICMECRIEDCREHAVMVGISTTGSLFDELRNPYIKWK